MDLRYAALPGTSEREVREPATYLAARPKAAVISKRICRLLPLARNVCEEPRRLAFGVRASIFVVFKDINDRHTVEQVLNCVIHHGKGRESNLGGLLTEVPLARITSSKEIWHGASSKV